MPTLPSTGPIVPAIAASLAAFAYTAALGADLVYPPNVEWLLHADFSLHFFGWHLYRTGPWSWPLGASPHLIWPVGSSVGLTDSIPLASVVFKAAGPWLPADFQFIGLWLVLCAALQAWFGALLMQRATTRPSAQLIGALILVASPPFLLRYVHAALAAHWVLLAAFWLYGRPGGEAPATGHLWRWALLAAVTAAIQPYLLLMVVAIMSAAFLRQMLESPAARATAATHATLAMAAAGLTLWQSGSLSVPGAAGLTMGGFGVYSANLLTFIMPSEGLTWLAPGPIPYANPEQYEGYAYLGAGVILLVLVVPGLRAWRPGTRPPAPTLRARLPLVLALAVLTAMALGPVVSAGRYRLLSYDPQVWGPLLTFRTNGRMIWPLYYAVVVAVLGAVARLPHRVAILALSVALAVQMTDLGRAVAWLRAPADYGFREPLVSPFWTIAARHLDRIVVVPSNLCDRNGAPDLRPFLLLAGRTGLAINAGATARYDTKRAAEYCAALEDEVAAGLHVDGTLYVMRPESLPVLAPPGDPGRVCGEVDGAGVCVATASYERWRHELPLPLR